jgi:hypothetical protein
MKEKQLYNSSPEKPGSWNKRNSGGIDIGSLRPLSIFYSPLIMVLTDPASLFHRFSF